MISGVHARRLILHTFVLGFVVFLALPDERGGRGVCSRMWRIFGVWVRFSSRVTSGGGSIPALAFFRSRETFDSIFI